MPELATQALEACRDYDYWSWLVQRLTKEISECECPNEIEPEGLVFGTDAWDDWHGSGHPTHFTAAKERLEDVAAYRLSRPDGPYSSDPVTLDHIAAAPEVRSCPSCSRLVELIRCRKDAKKRLAVAKRAIRRIGKKALIPDPELVL